MISKSKLRKSASRKPRMWRPLLEGAPRKSNNPAGRPITGAERKRSYLVMLEPAVAERLRTLGWNNLSRGIALAAAKKENPTRGRVISETSIQSLVLDSKRAHAAKSIVPGA